MAPTPPRRAVSPIHLVLVDGRSFQVPHPDFLSIAPKGTDLALWAKDGHIGGYLDSRLIAEARMEKAKRKSSRRH